MFDSLDRRSAWANRQYTPGRDDASRRPLTDRKPSRSVEAKPGRDRLPRLAPASASHLPQKSRIAAGCSSGGPVRPGRLETGLVRFENVGLRYGLGPEVLRDLSFRIEPHSFQFLTGPSGAGKSSLLRLLFLSLKPTRGLMTLFGQDIATLTKDALATLRRRIGLVFQDFRLLDHLTTYDNVALPLRVAGRTE